MTRSKIDRNTNKELQQWKGGGESTSQTKYKWKIKRFRRTLWCAWNFLFFGTPSLRQGRDEKRSKKRTSLKQKGTKKRRETRTREEKTSKIGKLWWGWTRTTAATTRRNTVRKQFWNERREERAKKASHNAHTLLAAWARSQEVNELQKKQRRKTNSNNTRQRSQRSKRKNADKNEIREIKHNPGGRGCRMWREWCANERAGEKERIIPIFSQVEKITRQDWRRVRRGRKLLKNRMKQRQSRVQKREEETGKRQTKKQKPKTWPGKTEINKKEFSIPSSVCELSLL